MSLLAGCYRRSSSLHDLPSSFVRVGGFASRRSISDAPPVSGTLRRRWPSYILVFSAGFGAAIAYNLYNDTTLSSSLNPRTFTPFTLVSKEPISPTSSIFTLRPTFNSNTDKAYEDIWKKGVWSVQFKQPQLQIARAYTPLPPSQVSSSEVSDHAHELQFLIRRDPQGEVSRYLHKLPNGASVELRGPNIEYILREDVEEVVFLAGGTGIAPALQVVYSLLLAQRDAVTKSKIHILWACRKREDCLGGVSDHGGRQLATHRGTWRSILGLGTAEDTGPKHASLSVSSRIVEELNAFKARHPDRISIDYFVDEENTLIGINDIRRLITPAIAQRFNEPDTTGKAAPGKNVILVSGPDGFVDHYAGPKRWEGGKEVQGNLSGILANLDLRSWQIWKL